MATQETDDLVGGGVLVVAGGLDPGRQQVEGVLADEDVQVDVPALGVATAGGDHAVGAGGAGEPRPVLVVVEADGEIVDDPERGAGQLRGTEEPGEGLVGARRGDDRGPQDRLRQRAVLTRPLGGGLRRCGQLVAGGAQPVDPTG
ncbi:MAG TPA: hypothetical protein PKA98_09485, partial [Acidimicrobiales bacterium]|nr:hypothetical protein [Acidimicrobiales bacterium]